METGALIGRGATAEIFGLDGGRVLKLYRKQIPAILPEREYSSTRAARACGIRVPEAFEYVEQDGRRGIVFERIVGQSMMRAMLKPFAIKKYARLLAALQAKVHRKTTEELPKYKDLLAENIRRAPYLTDAEKQQVLDVLAKLPDGNAVCHGDFHPDNIMLTKSGPVIMDWMTAGRGAPAADATRTLLMLSTSELPDGTPGPVKLLFSLIRPVMKNAYLREYLKLSGLTPNELNQWTLPLAAARLNESRPEAESQLLHDIVTAGLRSITESIAYEIRLLAAADVPGALALVWETFLEFEAPDYSPEGVRKFKECLDDPEFVGRLTLYGAFADGALTGVIATREHGSHISLFFVRGARHRRGIGRRLFEFILPDCPGHTLTVNSSPFAVPVYRKLGFTATGPEQVTDGIRFTPMAYHKN